MRKLNPDPSVMLAPLRTVTIAKLKLTSIVLTGMPAGFQFFLFQPSTHMAPREMRLTVPSPSPILTPFFTYIRNGSAINEQGLGLTTRRGRTFGFAPEFSTTAVSIQFSLNSGMSRGGRGIVSVDAPGGISSIPQSVEFKHCGFD